MIVIVPLVRLGKLQAQGVNRHGQAEAERLNSAGLKASFTTKAQKVEEAVNDSSITYLFMSPELAKNTLIDCLLELSVEQLRRFTHIFIDESHCVVKW